MVASLHKDRQRWTPAAGMHFQFIKLHTIFGTDLLFFSIDMLKNDGTVPMISLFKQKRTKGWWPLYIKTDNDGLLLQVCICIT
jgi:hypothetical protein